MRIITHSKYLREKQLVVYWIQIAFYIMALLCHVTGFVALYRYKKKNNQNIILFCISLVEINLIIFGVIIRTDEHYVDYNTKEADTILNGIIETVVFQLVFTMYILTVDRLICVINPLKYCYRVTRAKLVTSIVLTCFLSLVLTILAQTLHPEQMHIIFYIFIAVGISYVAVSIFTYSYIFYAVQKSNERFQSQASPRKQFLVPGLIILTFFIFYLIPFLIERLEVFGVIYHNATYEEHFMRHLICQTFQIVGLVADPLVYILITKHYRDAVFSVCKKERQRRDEIEMT